jgi:hypothetical protein
MKRNVLFKVILTVVMLIMMINVNLSAQDNQEKVHPQFLFPAFSNATILKKDGTRAELKLNYNKVEERMVMEENGQYWYLKNIEYIDTIYLNNRKFFLNDNCFFEVIADGHIPVYLQSRAILTIPGSDIGYGIKNQNVEPVDFKRYAVSSGVVLIDLPPNTSVKSTSLLWVKRNNEMEKFTNKKQLINLLPEYSAELTKYFKQNRVDLKEHQDIVQLGTFIESLNK